MNWLTESLSSTLGKKLIMALTGLFLVLFLIGHVTGNLLLFKNDGGQAFNEYSKFMTSTPYILILSYLTYFSIIFHTIYSIVLTRYNAGARKNSYAVKNASENSSWASRNMGVLGALLFLFIFIHMKNFWYEYKFGEVPMVEYAGSGKIKDLYSVVVAAFSQWWYTLFYVASMVFLAIHLSHGFQSAFQTLGLSHVKYTPLIKATGKGFAVIVCLLFASMPIYIFFKNFG